MIVLINYANEKYKSVRKWNTISAKRFNFFDKIYEFSPDDIDSDFRNTNATIFQYERGDGLWLWKPYIINKIIDELNEGDIIFYVDAASIFIRNPIILMKYIDAKNPVFVTDIPLLNSCFTKPECFDIMNAWQFADYNQIQAGFQIIQITQDSRTLYKSWLKLCENHDLISPAGMPRGQKIIDFYGSKFVSHREDQSIFSLLCYLHGITPHRDVTQRGKDPFSFYHPAYTFRVPQHNNDTYDTIIYLHKSTSLGFSFLFKLIKNKLARIKKLFICHFKKIHR